MYKSIILSLLLLFLSACGGGSTHSIIPPESETPDIDQPVIDVPQIKNRVIDTEVWKYNSCIFYYSDTYLSIYYREANFREVLVGDIISINCTDELVSPDVTLPDIGLFINLKSIVLGWKYSSMRIGSLDGLTKLKKLKSITLDSWTEDTSPDTWEQLTLESLTIVQSGIPQISKIKTLKFLDMNVGDPKDLELLANLKNLEELSIEFSNPNYVDAELVGNIKNIKTLSLAVWPDDIDDFFPRYAEEDGDFSIKHFDVLNTIPNLTSLTLNNLNVSNLNTLANFNSLIDFSITPINIFFDYSSLKCGDGLRVLQVGYVHVDDYDLVASKVEFDESCKNITELNLEEVVDISTLNLKKIKKLNISRLINLSPDELELLANLEELEFNFDGVTEDTILLLLSLKKLKALRLSRFSGDISQFSNSQLEELELSNMPTDYKVDYSQLVCGTKLTNLNLQSNKIKDIIFDSSCSNLLSLDLKYNEISDLSFLLGFQEIKKLSLAYNNISDLSPLFTLQSLEKITLWGNNLNADQITDLKDATNVEVVDFLDTGE